MSAAPRDPVRLRVDAHASPAPALLRPAIEAALAGRAWSGPEAAVGDAVAQAVERAARAGAGGERKRTWR